MSLAGRRIAIVHEALPADARPDERDALDQSEHVNRVLRDLGADVDVIPVDLDLGALQARLNQDQPDLVFNLVEALSGQNRLISVVPALLESMGITFVGSGSLALAVTTDKCAAKKRLDAAGLPTPAWWRRHDPAPPPSPNGWILKPIFEDASFGIDDDAIVGDVSLARLAQHVAERGARLGAEVFAEHYVPGREFNLSVLADGENVRVLPPAEIEFVNYSHGKPAIVGYAAKWDSDSHEYAHTPRRFDFGPADGPLLGFLGTLARRCWRLFELRGWARVDFRVDGAGRPWILEVNANPCLTPDAGFHAAATHAALSPHDVILALVQDAVRSAPRERPHDVSHPPNL